MLVLFLVCSKAQFTFRVTKIYAVQWAKRKMCCIWALKPYLHTAISKAGSVCFSVCGIGLHTCFLTVEMMQCVDSSSCYMSTMKILWVVTFVISPSWSPGMPLLPFYWGQHIWALPPNSRALLVFPFTFFCLPYTTWVSSIIIVFQVLILMWDFFLCGIKTYM